MADKPETKGKGESEQSGASPAAEAQTATAQSATQPQPGGQPQQQQVTIDDANIEAHYANFCRVSSTPEELILDLGLNPNPFGGNTTVRVGQRIILNHFTAKRLLSALSMALQRHEQAFGVLETDIRKRVKQS